MIKINNIEALEQYEFLLEEKSEVKKISLEMNAELLKESLNPFSLVTEKLSQVFPLEGNTEIKAYTAVELVNWVYKLITQKKETPSIIRLIRMYLPKYFALKNSITE